MIVSTHQRSWPAMVQAILAHCNGFVVVHRRIHGVNEHVKFAAVDDARSRATVPLLVGDAAAGIIKVLRPPTS